MIDFGKRKKTFSFNLPDFATAILTFRALPSVCTYARAIAAFTTVHAVSTAGGAVVSGGALYTAEATIEGKHRQQENTFSSILCIKCRRTGRCGRGCLQTVAVVTNTSGGGNNVCQVLLAHFLYFCCFFYDLILRNTFNKKCKNFRNDQNIFFCLKISLCFHYISLNLATANCSTNWPQQQPTNFKFWVTLLKLYFTFLLHFLST